MKQNKKGFTLIELLAVIVILAIIALIAVPVIMNIISSARKSAFEDTAYGIIKAGELYYASSLLNDGMTTDAEFTFTEGAVSPDGLSVQGSLPPSGKLVVTTDGKTAIAISNGTYCVTKGYEESKIKTAKDDGNCKLPEEQAVNTLKDIATTTTEVTSVNACATDGTACAPGTKFAIKVNDGATYNFYVISDVNNEVTLIMDRNIGDSVAWINNVDYKNSGGSQENWDNEQNMNIYGPITALNYLESQTSSWTNIAAKDYAIIDSEYGEMTRTGARTRMLTKSEALSLGCIEEDVGCPTWLYTNLSLWDGVDSWYEDIGIYGYWLSTASAVDKSSWRVGSDALLYDLPSVDNSYGVRPVIEISK